VHGSPALISAKAYDQKGNEIKRFGELKTGPGDDDHLHFENFIDAVRDGQREKLHAEILEGHVSASVCHTGNISYRLGKKAPVDEIRKVTGEIPAWNDTFDRLLAHLRANEIDVEDPTITLGPWLETVPGEERFQDNAAANALVKGFFRAPYEVPDVKV
jgi:hypothetical protein